MDIDVANRGDELLTSRRRYPINVSYHITDTSGSVIIYDGERTPINEFIRKGLERTITMKIGITDVLKKGEVYNVDITLVAEGCFWLDKEGKNMKRVLLTII